MQVQITTLCISVSLSAYVTLFCLFSPKLYIIVFQVIRVGSGNEIEILREKTRSILCFLPSENSLSLLLNFQPEKNVRKLTMNSTAHKKNTTSLISTFLQPLFGDVTFRPPLGGGLHKAQNGFPYCYVHCAADGCTTNRQSSGMPTLYLLLDPSSSFLRKCVCDACL